MAVLEPSLRPGGERALARLRERDRRFRIVRRNWSWATAVATVACVVLIALPSKSVCCARTPEAAAETPAPAPAPIAAEASAPAPEPAQVAAEPPQMAAPAIQVAHSTSYKASGSPTAPVVIEIYSDFQCPACAAFYRDVFPQLDADYVKTGKVRIVHRDFPLPQHQFAKLAARYANAAGEVGRYDTVFARLFATQAEWEQNGNIEAALAPVLAPDALAKIRGMAAGDLLDSEAAADIRMGLDVDRLTQTPTVIVVSGGVRNKIAGGATVGVLSAYIDEKLKNQ